MSIVEDRSQKIIHISDKIVLFKILQKKGNVRLEEENIHFWKITKIMKKYTKKILQNCKI